MKGLAWLDERPIIVAIAGPNGAGKTTFYHAHLEPAALRFVSADVLAHELDLEPYAAARAADALRRALAKQRESFVFETVFSDPAGDKLAFLEEAAASGYAVALIFIGISGPRVSEERIAMRVSQGGHDVPPEKLRSRFPRTLANLKKAMRVLRHVLIYDNDDLGVPFRRVAVFEQGRLAESARPLPRWLRPIVKRRTWPARPAGRGGTVDQERRKKDPSAGSRAFLSPVPGLPAVTRRHPAPDLRVGPRSRKPAPGKRRDRRGTAAEEMQEQIDGVGDVHGA